VDCVGGQKQTTGALFPNIKEENEIKGTIHRKEKKKNR